MNERISGFDFLRIIAAFSVVWIHGSSTNIIVGQINTINSYAVPCFILMSIYLLCIKISDPKFFSQDVIFEKLYRRIIPQFIFWTIVYLFARYIKSKFTVVEFEIDLFSLLFGGGAVQLWFLPALILWYALIVWSGIIKKKASIDLIMMFCAFNIGLFLFHQHYLSKGFFNCFAIYTGYIFFATFIYKKREIFKIFSPYTYLALAIIAFIFRKYFEFDLMNIIYSSSLFLFFLFKKFKSPKFVIILANNSFGIYLIHFIYLQIFQLLSSKIKIDNTSIYFSLSNIIFSFICAFVTSYYFKQKRILHQLV